MNEQELSHALRGTLAAGSPPLALDAQGMLAHAKRARARRRSAAVVGGSAFAACAVAGSGALAGTPLGLGSGSIPILAGAGGGTGEQCITYSQQAPVNGGAEATPTGSPSLSPTGAPTGTPSGTPTNTGAPVPTPTTCYTQTPWPSGQSDRTAYSGPHKEIAVQLQTALLQALPSGAQAVSPNNQAQYEDTVQGVEVWESLAQTGVRLGGHTSDLLVRVLSPTPGDHTDLCVLAGYFQAQPGPQCHVTTVQGKRVALATRRNGNSTVGYSPEMAAWVVYRAPDGTVVWIAQGHGDDSSTPLPFSNDQLAKLAVSGRFHG